MASKIYKVVLLLFLSILCATDSQAAHIIGGEITYTCLGGANYRFTLKLYRDCEGGGAPFDSQDEAYFWGTVTVYKGKSKTPFIDIIQLPAPVINDISIDDNSPCLDVVEEYCMQEGVYQFEVELEPSDQAYHITYQRCCRNLTAANVLDPENTGATFTVTLTPEAQGVRGNCRNSSPTFNNNPDILICGQESYELDLSATDDDNDQLVYSLCAPLVGGGPEGSGGVGGDPFQLDGIAPNPDAPPPYDAVPLVRGFSVDQPLGNRSQIEINSATGLIKLNAKRQGHYIIGVCVEEYRDGKLLSTVRRDFQINVVQCVPVVQALIDYDTIINDNIFVVNSCSPILNLDNKSEKEEYINSYLWSFDLNSGPFSSTEKDISIAFPEKGVFEGSLILNKNELCTDTAFIRINVKPKLLADFDFEQIECKDDPIVFADQSFSESNGLKEWIWDFGNGDTSYVQNPVHQYAEAGNHEVNLLVRDTAGCKASMKKELAWFPLAEKIEIDVTNEQLCAPEWVSFQNLMPYVNDLYNIEWEFGDGGFSTELHPNYQYQHAGNFTVTLDISTPSGCQLNASFEDYIQVNDSPIAAFDFLPKAPSSVQPTVSFSNSSTLASASSWYINGELMDRQSDFTFTFPDTGFNQVMLVVEHSNGCRDTLTQLIDISPQINFFLPNAFTPNADGLNDEFKAVGFFGGIQSYNMQIFNRWGNQVFETADPNMGWDGRLPSGRWSEEGVYVVIVQFREPRGEIREVKSFATLIK